MLNQNIEKFVILKIQSIWTRYLELVEYPYGSMDDCSKNGGRLHSQFHW